MLSIKNPNQDQIEFIHYLLFYLLGELKQERWTYSNNEDRIENIEKVH